MNCHARGVSTWGLVIGASYEDRVRFLGLLVVNEDHQTERLPGIEGYRFSMSSVWDMQGHLRPLEMLFRNRLSLLFSHHWGTTYVARMPACGCHPLAGRPC